MSTEVKNEGLTKDKAIVYGVLGILGIGVGVAVYFGVRGKIKSAIAEKKQEKYTNQIGTNTNEGKAAEYAQRLKTAMFSTYSWFPDGTDEEAMYQVAKEMFSSKVTFAQVSDAYKNIFSRNLSEDMIDEMDTNDFQKFQTALRTGILSGLGNPITIKL